MKQDKHSNMSKLKKSKETQIEILNRYLCLSSLLSYAQGRGAKMEALSPIIKELEELDLLLLCY